jgi:GNAT superfamily N-acetyltransferase
MAALDDMDQLAAARAGASWREPREVRSMATRTPRKQTRTARTRKTASAAKTAKSAAKPRATPSGNHALVAAPPSRDAPHWTETLRDGTHVIIRPIRKEDAALERAFLKRLSPESRRLRFLGQMNDISDALVRALTDIDYRRDVAFVALVHRDGEKREIGVARYGASKDGKACECAVAVADEWRNRGVGVLLMRHLIDVARSRGVRSMFSIDEADNEPMRELARFLGFKRKRDPDDATQVVHTLALG